MTASGAPGAAAAVVLERLALAPALLPGGSSPTSGRLLCLDGPAGAGKSTLAAAVLERLGAAPARPGARLVHMDDLYEGWHGLGDVAERLRDRLVRPLAVAGEGRYRRWDWHADAWAEEHAVAPVDLLVLEGVGSGTPELDPWRSLLVWVEAPPDLRMRRGVARDGDAFAARWERWAADEERLWQRDRTRERADLRVDGTGATPPVARGGG